MYRKIISIVVIIFILASCSSMSYEDQQYQKHQELCETYIEGYEDCYRDISNSIGDYIELLKEDVFSSLINDSGYAPDEIQSIIHQYCNGEYVDSNELHYAILYLADFFDYFYENSYGLPNDYEIFNDYYEEKCEMDYNFDRY